MQTITLTSVLLVAAVASLVQAQGTQNESHDDNNNGMPLLGGNMNGRSFINGLRNTIQRITGPSDQTVASDTEGSPQNPPTQGSNSGNDQSYMNMMHETQHEMSGIPAIPYMLGPPLMPPHHRHVPPPFNQEHIFGNQEGAMSPFVNLMQGHMGAMGGINQMQMMQQQMEHMIALRVRQEVQRQLSRLPQMLQMMQPPQQWAPPQVSQPTTQYQQEQSTTSSYPKQLL